MSAGLLVACAASSRKIGTSVRTAGTAAVSVRIPRDWKTACELSGACDPLAVSGRLPPGLFRRLHFPRAKMNACPATSGHSWSSPIYGRTIAFGRRRRVWVVIANGGDLRRGYVDMGAGNAAGWHGLKAHFLGTPGYQGPLLVRAQRLGRPGSIRVGSSHLTHVSWLVVPAGPTANTTGGWRDVPSSTWVKHTGCYGWQIDGLTFSEVVVVNVRPHS